MFFELLPFWGGWLILVNQGQQENDQSCNHFSLFHMFDHVQWSESSLYGSDRPLCKEEIYITSVIHTLGWWSFIAPPFNEIHQHIKIDNVFLLYSNFLHKHSISHNSSLIFVCWHILTSVGVSILRPDQFSFNFFERMAISAYSL